MPLICSSFLYKRKKSFYFCIFQIVLYYKPENYLTAPALLMLIYVFPGIADVVGKHLGKERLPYNPNKSHAGSIAIAGFLASVGQNLY
jgi:dolichol kinase